MKKLSIIVSVLITLITAPPAFASWLEETIPTPQVFTTSSNIGMAFIPEAWACNLLPSLPMNEGTGSFSHTGHTFDRNMMSGEIRTEAIETGMIRFPSMNMAHDDVAITAALNDSDELSHQALASVMKESDLFYVVSASGTLPVLDDTFRDFIDYGASVSFGMGKRINEKLSVTATIGVTMMTGDWAIKGDRQSIEVAAEEYYPGLVTEPGVVITPEDLDDENLGISYHSDAEATITSAESLEKIDVHTDLYLFPVSVNALYRFKQTEKFSAYAGGGLGFCVATRDCDSSAMKNKYFSGPDYKISMNDSQTVTGLLVNLVAGVNIPIHEKLKFVAEASSTLYDLKSFDPVLEISFTKANPDWYEGSDLSQWSYENPLRVGVYKEVYVTNVSAGFIMPF